MRFRVVVRVTVLSAMSAGSAPADMVVLRDGTHRAGIVVSEQGGVVVQAGRDAGAARTAFGLGDVVRVLRGVEETKEIGTLTSVPELTRLAEEYHAAGLEILATTCLTRAVDIDRAVAARPRTEGAAELVAFWNRMLLNYQERRISRRDYEAQLALARWARKAELIDDSIRLLRRASETDPQGQQLEQLATEWNVDLRPVITIDLSPALYQQLVMQTLSDEGMNLVPRQDGRFVAVPFRYRRDVATLIRRSSIDVRPVPSAPCRIVGFQPLLLEFGRLVLPHAASDPVYEELEIEVTAAGRSRLLGINKLGPPGPDGTKNVRVGAGKDRLASTGWAVVWVDVDLGAKSLRVAPARSPGQEISIAFLREAGRLVEDPGNAESAGIQRLLRYATDSSPAVAAQAIRRLGEIRRSLLPDSYARWSAVVDELLLAAAGRTDEDVRRESWRCLIDHGPMPASTQRRIASAATELRWSLLGQIQEDLYSPALNDVAYANVISILATLMQGDQTDLCWAVVEMLARGAPREMYGLLSDASPTTRGLALARCETIDDRAIRERFVRPLMRQATAEELDSLAAVVRREAITVIDPDDPFLHYLLEVEDDSKLSVGLELLRHVSMEPVRGSEPFRRLLENSTSGGASPSVHDAAIRLAATVAARAYADDPRGAFPVRFDENAEDPIHDVMSRAVVAGPDDLRLTAMLTLLLDGNVPAAHAALSELASSKAAAAERLLDRVCATPGAEVMDSTICLLGRLLSEAGVESAKKLLLEIDRRASARPEADTARVNLCLKGGLDCASLADFSSAADPELAALADKWAGRLAHFSAQDRIQFVAAADRASRIDRLRHAANRRGRIVVGPYGVVVVAEIAERLDAVDPAAEPIWLPPRRVTLSAGSVELRSDGPGHAYRVFRGDALIGAGTAQTVSMPLGQPEEWLPRIVPLESELRQMPDGESDRAATPLLVFATGEDIPGETPGAMRIEAGRLLREALAMDPAGRRYAAYSGELVPSGAAVSLRHVGMGTYVGAGARRAALPVVAATTQPASPFVLVNFVVLLEQM